MIKQPTFLQLNLFLKLSSSCLLKIVIYLIDNPDLVVLKVLVF